MLAKNISKVVIEYETPRGEIKKSSNELAFDEYNIPHVIYCLIEL